MRKFIFLFVLGIVLGQEINAASKGRSFSTPEDIALFEEVRQMHAARALPAAQQAEALGGVEALLRSPHSLVLKDLIMTSTASHDFFNDYVGQLALERPLVRLTKEFIDLLTQMKKENQLLFNLLGSNVAEIIRGERTLPIALRDILTVREHHVKLCKLQERKDPFEAENTRFMENFYHETLCQAARLISLALVQEDRERVFSHFPSIDIIRPFLTEEQPPLTLPAAWQCRRREVEIIDQHGHLTKRTYFLADLETLMEEQDLVLVEPQSRKELKEKKQKLLKEMRPLRLRYDENIRRKRAQEAEDREREAARVAESQRRTAFAERDAASREAGARRPPEDGGGAGSPSWVLREGVPVSSGRHSFEQEDKVKTRPAYVVPPSVGADTGGAAIEAAAGGGGGQAPAEEENAPHLSDAIWKNIFKGLSNKVTYAHLNILCTRLNITITSKGGSHRTLVRGDKKTTVVEPHGKHDTFGPHALKSIKEFILSLHKDA